MRLFLALLVSLWALTLPATAQSATTFDSRGWILDLKDQQLVVLGVLPGSPAAEAQVQPGDMVVGLRRSGRGADFVAATPETLHKIVSDLGHSNRPLSVRLQRYGKTLEVELARAPVAITTSALRGMPEGRVVKSQGRIGYVGFRQALGYDDKLAVIMGGDVLGTAVVMDKEGQDYRVRFHFGRNNQDLSNARVVLLEHDSRYFANASQGRTEGGRLSKPYTVVSAALKPYDKQVRDGVLKKHGGTVRELNIEEGTFVIRWQQGHSGPVSLNGGQLRSTATFNSGDPIQVLRIRYKGAPVWFSADRDDAGKDASAKLRNEMPVQVYYRPIGSPVKSTKRGRKTQEHSGQAELVIMDSH